MVLEVKGQRRTLRGGENNRLRFLKMVLETIWMRNWIGKGREAKYSGHEEIGVV